MLIPRFQPKPSIHLVYITIFPIRTGGYSASPFPSIPEYVHCHTPDLVEYRQQTGLDSSHVVSTLDGVYGQHWPTHI